MDKDQHREWANQALGELAERARWDGPPVPDEAPSGAPEVPPGMPSQSYAVPYGTVRRLTELLDTRPGGWVAAVETLLEFTDKVKTERDLARVEAEKLHRQVRDLQSLRGTLTDLLERVAAAVGIEGSDWEAAVIEVEGEMSSKAAPDRSVPSSAALAASLAPDLDDVQRLRASMVRDLIVHAEMPPASVPAEVDRLVRYVLEGRP